MNTYEFSDLLPGKKETLEVEVSAGNIDRFEEISGDDSPIHKDAQFARDRGFEDRLAHGLLLGAYVSRFLGTILPGANGLLQMIEMQYRKPCTPGTRVAIEGEIVRQVDSVQAIQISLTIRRVKDQGILATGRAQVGILKPGQPQSGGIGGGKF